MSKIKLSFSFLLALLLVGLFSAVAFAATGTSSATTPDPATGTTTAGTTMQPVTGDSTNDNKWDGGTTASNANQTGKGVGTNDGSTFNTVDKASSLHVDPTNPNSNIQRTHGSYMNNTNSCASCHQTHTGAAGSLLFKDGAYETCTACHDGTLGFYNVFSTDTSKTDGSGFDNSAGTFGGTADGNMSVHLATGAVQFTAAPGGDRNNTTGTWNEEFTCASCHAPHGSYSDRLLNENPNDMANTTVQNGGQEVQNVPVVDSTVTGFSADFNTKYAAADQTIHDAAGDRTVNFIVFRFVLGTGLNPTNTITKITPTGKITYNAYTDTQNGGAGLQNGDTVLQVMKWDQTQNNNTGAYVVDQAPWFHEYDFDSSHKKHMKTAFYDGIINIDGTYPDGTYTGTKYAANYADPAWQNKPKEMFDTDYLTSGEVLGAGFAGVLTHDTADFPNVATLVTTVNSLKTGKIARSYVVKLDVTPSATPDLASKNVVTTNVASLWDSSNTGYVSGRGVAMSTWCAACHTDYLANSGDAVANSGKGSGHFDTAYRHTTTSDTYTCIRCHFSHGTDMTVMRDARGLTYNQILTGDTSVGGDHYFSGVTSDARTTDVQNYMKDQNPDSALKRYTNMAICWGCHTSSHSGGTRNTDTYQFNPTPGVNTDRNGIGNTVGAGTVNAGY